MSAIPQSAWWFFSPLVQFLLGNLITDELLDGLYLASKYDSTVLYNFCKKKIDERFPNVLDGICFGGGVKMVPSLKNWSLLSNDLKDILPHILSSAQKFVFSLSKPIFPVIISGRYAYDKSVMKAEETITFSIEKNMLLSEIHLAEIYKKSYQQGTTEWETFSLEGLVIIKKQTSTAELVNQRFGSMRTEKHLKLNKPVLILEGRYY